MYYSGPNDIWPGPPFFIYRRNDLYRESCASLAFCSSSFFVFHTYNNSSTLLPLLCFFLIFVFLLVYSVPNDTWPGAPFSYTAGTTWPASSVQTRLFGLPLSLPFTSRICQWCCRCYVCVCVCFNISFLSVCLSAVFPRFYWFRFWWPIRLGILVCIPGHYGRPPASWPTAIIFYC